MTAGRQVIIRQPQPRCNVVKLITATVLSEDGDMLRVKLPGKSGIVEVNADTTSPLPGTKQSPSPARYAFSNILR